MKCLYQVINYLQLVWINSQTANTVCLNWINEKFMLGGIISKPSQSQFISYSLTAQADSNYYKEQQEDYKTKYDRYSIVSSSPLSFSGSQLTVAPTNVKSVNSIEFKNVMDATYALMVNSGKYYSTSFFYYT